VITAIIAGILLFLLGVAAKGVFAHALILVSAWLAKNGLMISFFQTKLGQRTARGFRWKAYSHLPEGSRRQAFRVFKRIGAAEKRTISVFSRIWAGLTGRRKPLARRIQVERSRRHGR